MLKSNDAVQFSDRVIEVLKKIPLTLVFSILSILFLMIYWFIAIFLFHRAFYVSNPIWITLIFCFAFSFTWFILIFGLTIFTVTFLDKEANHKTKNSGVLLLSGFNSIVYLCLCIAVVYIIRMYRYPLLKFEFFLLASYIYIVFLLVKTGIVLIRGYCQDKKVENQTQE